MSIIILKRIIVAHVQLGSRITFIYAFVYTVRKILCVHQIITDEKERNGNFNSKCIVTVAHNSDLFRYLLCTI